MIQRTFSLVVLTLCLFLSPLAQAQEALSNTLFVSWSELSTDNYAELKSAFDDHIKLDLASISLQGKLLCIAGSETQMENWEMAKALILSHFPGNDPIWESAMSKEEYLIISRSYRLSPAE